MVYFAGGNTSRRLGSPALLTRYSRLLIDPSGVVSRAYYNVKATGHVARLRQELGI